MRALLPLTALFGYVLLPISALAADPIPTIGDVYWLKTRPLCLDDYKQFDGLTDAAVKHDDEGEAQIIAQHGVNVPSGTHVRILNVDIFRSDVDVRVVSGDSDHYGEEIYCLIPSNSNSEPMFSKVLQRVPSR
jgi:hypothetical protein